MFKGTSTYDSVASTVADTRALKLLKGANAAKRGLTARGAARLVTVVDDSAAPFVRNAQTAGEVFYRWRMVQQIDADIEEELSDAQLSNLMESIVRRGEDGGDVIDGVSEPTRRAMADGGDASDDAFRDAVYDAANSDVFDSFEQIDDAVGHIESLSGPAKAQTRIFVAESYAYGLRTVLRFGNTPSANLGSFVRKVEPFSEGEKRQIARMAAEANDGAKLVDELGYGQLQRIVDQDAEMTAARLSNRGVDASNIKLLVNEGLLKRVDELMVSRYTTFSKDGKGFEGHYSDHANKWSPRLSRDQYRSRAREVMNRERSGLEVYYQKNNGNLIVYDRSTNELAIGGNKPGEIQTFLKPDSQDYVDENAGGNWLPVK